MNKKILHQTVQEWLAEHLTSDIKKLIFQKSPFDDIAMSELVSQLEAKQKCLKKLPTWYEEKGIYYPAKLSVEQTSSEQTAQYKASLIEGNSLVDITGGFGVDAYYFSKQFNTVIHLEQQASLASIAQHNFKVLNVLNIQSICGDGLDYVTNKKFDWIYLDPARRHNSKGKVFFLSDCEPNVTENLLKLFASAHHILIKTSPMLDITQGLRELKFVKEIHVVSVKNEVKELLWILEYNYEGNIICKAVNLGTKNPIETFVWGDQKAAKYKQGKLDDYLYEPNASILKLNSVNLLLYKYNLIKINNKTQLLFGDDMVGFPGKKFVVLATFTFQKKELLKRYKGKKANVVSRNFSLTPKEIKKRFYIQDGGELFLFFTTNSDNKKIVIEAKKVEA